MKRAVIYARYSSNNQNESSIEAQIEQGKKYCDKNNMIVVGEYIDRGYTGMDDKRPEFQNMILDSYNDKFDIVIVYKLNRFARNLNLKTSYRHILRKNNVSLDSVIENIDESPEGRFLESIIDSMSEFYSLNLRRLVKRGMKTNAKKCLHQGGIPPLGYDVVDKKYLINDKEAYIVKKIYELYSKNYGYGKIVEILNKNNYKTKRGNPFKKNSLISILRNEKYNGTYVFNKTKGKSIDGTRNNHAFKDKNEIIKVEDGMPQIISDELWNLVQKKIRNNKHKGGRKRAKQNYFLSGKIICGECDSNFVGNSRIAGRNKNLYVTYKCNNKQRKGKCSTKELRRDYIDKVVIHYIIHNILNKKNAIKIAEYINAYLKSIKKDKSKELKHLKQRKNGVEMKINNIMKAIMEGLHSKSINKRIQELEKTKEEIGFEIEEFERKLNMNSIDTDEIISYFDSIKADFYSFIENQNYDIRKIKNLVNLFVNKVIVTNDIITINLSIDEALSLNIDKKKESTSNIKVSQLKKRPHNADVVLNGEGGGNRTHVQKDINSSFSEHSH